MREKIKLVSTAGTGHFYTTIEEPQEYGRQATTQEIRPGGSQARHL